MKKTHQVVKRRMRDELEESEHRFREILETVSLLAVILDRNGNITFCNDYLAKITGWKRQEVQGKNWFEFFMPRGSELKKLFHDSISKGKIFAHYENEILTRKGEKRLIRWSNTILHDINNNVLGTTSIGEDITDRRRAVEALRESEEKYRLSIDHIPIHIAAVDKKGKFIIWNKYSEKMLGYTQEEAVKGLKSLDVHFSKEEAEEVVNTAREKGIYDGEPSLRNKDGTAVPAHLVVVPYKNAEGEIIAFYGFAEDITERKKIEEMKQNIIRNVSHELKTPIAMAEMAYDMCSRAIKNKDIDGIKRAHKMALNNIKRMRADVDNILTSFSLVKKWESTIRKVSLKSVIKNIVADIETVLWEKKLSLKVNMPTNANNVLVDQHDLTIIMHNLVDNAIKFTAKGSVTISASLKNDMVYVKVKDTGCGIEPRMIDRVFGQFFKEVSSTPGTGLGLSICKDLAQRNGGDVEVKSKGRRQGTTVTLKLKAYKYKVH